MSDDIDGGSTTPAFDEADQLEAEQRWEELVMLLVERLDATTDPVTRAGLLSRAGDVFERRLANPENAFVVLVQAFGEVADDDAYGQRLARLAARAGTWDELLAAYEQAADEAGSGSILLRRRLAEWYGARDATEDAVRHWAEVARLDPADGEAQRALEAAYEDGENWHALVELLAGRLEGVLDGRDRLKLQRRIARIVEERMGAPHDAVAWLGQAWLDSDDDGVFSQLERLADACGAHAALAEVLRRRLEATAVNLSDTAPLHLRLARLYAERLDDGAQAMAHYEQVVALDPDNVRAVQALRAQAEASEDWGRLSKILQREAELTGDRYERFKRYLALGDLYRDKLDSDAEAVKAWFQALDARPDDKQVLVRLLDVYSETERWEAAAKVLNKLSKLVEDPAKQAQYVYAVGIIQRDHLNDRLNAVRTLDRALELDPTMVKAFQAIDEVLTDDRDHARQDRYYRKMLVRAREYDLDDALVVMLARNLGEINRTRLGNHEAALKAYEIVLRKRPDDVDTRGIVTELYTLTGRIEEATQTAFELVEADPADAAGYHLLARLHQKQGRRDAAWCVCQALSTVGETSEEERRFYHQGRERQGRARRGLEGADWQRLTWPDKSGAIDALLLHLAPVVGPLMAATPKDYRLNPKTDRIDLQKVGTFGRVLEYVAGTMGVGLPAVWHCPAQPGLAAVLFEDGPALLAGDDLAQASVEQLAFLCAHELYLVGHQHVLTTLDATAEVRAARLTGLFGTVLKALHPQRDVAHDKKLLAALNKLPPGTLGRVPPLVAGLPNAPDFGVAAWLDAVEFTATRLGFLLSNRLSVAMKLSQTGVRPVGSASAGAKMRALLLFSISEPYFQLREGLGMAL